jgi:hypothetical protein
MDAIKTKAGANPAPRLPEDVRPDGLNVTESSEGKCCRQARRLHDVFGLSWPMATIVAALAYPEPQL